MDYELDLSAKCLGGDGGELGAHLSAKNLQTLDSMLRSDIVVE